MTSIRARLGIYWLLAGGTWLAGCDSRPVARPVPEKAPAQKVAPAAKVAPVVNEAEEGKSPKGDVRYMAFIRPMLTRRGCDSGFCHGTFKGGGFFLGTPDPSYAKDYQSILERIDRKAPAESILVKKALGQVSHSGGKNLADGDCDARGLMAWIGGQPDPVCQDDKPRPDRQARFVREVIPALRAMGCADQSCHGAPTGKAQGLLDLSAIAGAPAGEAQAGDVYQHFEHTQLHRTYFWKGTVVGAALGEDPAHKKAADPLGCAFRRLYGYLADAPETSCDVDRPMPAPRNGKIPSLGDFARVVMPGLSRRGCTDSSCHANGVNPMKLFLPDSDKHAPLHDYLALIARVEDFDKPEKSTLVRTVRNVEPHGGGQRLGGQGDCLDGLVMSWLRGQPVKACGKATPPSKERFIAEVQPVLDKMTCTQMACHGASIPVFKLIPNAKDAASLSANYQQMLREIDQDFMPFSPAMLRMREPCAYSTVGSWIEGKPGPICVMKDPDPTLFPKLERKIQKTHGAPMPPPTSKT